MDLIFCYKRFRTEAHRWGFLPMWRGSSRLLSEATPSPSEEARPPELCLAATPRPLVWNFLSTLPDSGAAGLLPLVRPCDLLWMAWQAVEVWPPLPPWPQLGGLQTSSPSPVATPKTFESQVPCCCRQRAPLCQDTLASPTPFSPTPRSPQPVLRVHSGFIGAWSLHWSPVELATPSGALGGARSSGRQGLLTPRRGGSPHADAHGRTPVSPLFPHVQLPQVSGASSALVSSSL